MVDLDGTPTLSMELVEIEAIVEAARGAADPSAATEADVATMPTLENIRIALGSASMAPAMSSTTDAPMADERGPRRAREVLRVDEIKLASQPPASSLPSRKP